MKYSQYEREVVRDFAKSDSWVDSAKAEHRKMVDEEIRTGLKDDAEAAAARAVVHDVSSSRRSLSMSHSVDAHHRQ